MPNPRSRKKTAEEVPPPQLPPRFNVIQLPFARQALLRTVQREIDATKQCVELNFQDAIESVDLRAVEYALDNIIALTEELAGLRSLVRWLSDTEGVDLYLCTARWPVNSKRYGFHIPQSGGWYLLSPEGRILMKELENGTQG